MNDNQISIIGGGIAGLATAIAAAKLGGTVTVYEKAETFDPVGAGLQLGPNAVRALKAIGAWDAVEPYTSSPPAICMRDGRTGKVLKQIKLGKNFESRFGQPYRVALRANLHLALLSVANQHSAVEIKLRQNIQVANLDQFHQIIAADGIASATRKKSFPSSAPIKANDVAYRSLFQAPAVAGLDMSCVNLWLCSGGHVVHYPVGQKQNLNVVAVTKNVPPQHQFAKAASALCEIIFASPAWTPWPLAHVPPLRAWSKGNITLVGDAAHGTLPYLAQGAAMALEDAAVLAETNFNMEKFYSERAARCAKLHQRSVNAGKIYHLSGPAATARNLALALMPERSFLSGLNWLYAGP